MLEIPSFYAGCINGLLILIIVVVIIRNRKEINTYDSYKQLMLLGMIAILIGVHALIHLGMEYVYNWNPLNYV